MSLHPHEDTLIDSALEEILGGVAPPDLKGRILKKLSVVDSGSDPERISVPDAPVSATSSTATRYARRRKRVGLKPWVALLVAACLVMMVGVVAFVANSQKKPAPIIASNTESNTGEKNLDLDRAVDESKKDSERRDVIGSESVANVDSDSIPKANDRDSVTLRDDDPAPTPHRPLLATTDFEGVERMADDEIVAFINERIRSKWQENNLEPSQPASASEWCSTTFEKLLGRKPNRREVREFTTDEISARKSNLVDRLLGKEYAQELVAHWQGRLGLPHAENSPMADLVKASLEQEQAFSELVRNQVQVAEASDFQAICSTFLGKRLDCVACHDRDEGGQSKERYTEFASAFNESDDEQRSSFAEAISRSDEMRRSTVNHLWAELLDYGFVPRDDLSGENVSHPQLLDGLAAQFAQHDHRLRDLMRWIVLSDAFGLSETTNSSDQPSAFRTAYFNVRYRPVVISESVDECLTAIEEISSVALVGSSEKASSVEATRAPSEKNAVKYHGVGLNEFMASMNRDADLLRIPTEKGSLIERLANSKLSSAEKIEHIFVAAAARKPTPSELTRARRMLRANRDDQLKTLRNVWWAILRSE